MVFLQDATLDGEGLKSGDLLLIEAGRLPPKVLIHIYCMLSYVIFLSTGICKDCGTFIQTISRSVQ